MKNKDLWTPSKFIKTKHGLKASRDVNHVAIGSRFVGDIQAAVYEHAIHMHACGVLLDLGCGNVPLYETYRDFVEEIICVDWEHSFHDNKYLDYVYDVNRKIPLPDNHFDTILTTDVLEHIAAPQQFWHEVARLLKPGGKVIMAVPFLYGIHEAPYDYARYTEYQISLACTQNGLKIIYLEPYGGSVEVILDIVAKHLKFSKLLSAIHLTVSKCLSRLLRGRQFYRKITRKFPLGYCLIAQKNNDR